MRLTKQAVLSAARRVVRQTVRLSDPRRGIYNIPVERRRAFREVMKDVRRLLGPTAPAAELVAINSWEALTRYSEADSDCPAYVVYDFQTSNRLSFLARASLLNFDGFDVFLNHLAVFLELCVATGRYDRVKRLLDRFDALKEGLAQSAILAYAVRDQHDAPNREQGIIDTRVMVDFFLPSYLMGHEIGHHLFPTFDRSSNDRFLLNEILYKMSCLEGDSFHLQIHGFSDGEFVFAENLVHELRAYRGGSKDMMEGLDHRIAREQERMSLREFQELYCDTTGLILALNALNDVNMFSRLPQFWMALYQSQTSLTFLSYLANAWCPVSNGAVPFLVPPIFERFMVPLRLLAERPGFDGLLERMGFDPEAHATVARCLGHWADYLGELAEDLADCIKESFEYEVMRAYNGRTAAVAMVGSGSVWAETDYLNHHHLFLQTNKREPPISDILLGSRLAFRTILECLAEEWREQCCEKSSEAWELPDDERTVLEQRVLGFRSAWRNYVVATIDRPLPPHERGPLSR